MSEVNEEDDSKEIKEMINNLVKVKDFLSKVERIKSTAVPFEKKIEQLLSSKKMQNQELEQVLHHIRSLWGGMIFFELTANEFCDFLNYMDECYRQCLTIKD